MDKNCIFCKIANGDLPKQPVYEDDLIIAFNDIHPPAPVHILIIPRKHIPSIDALEEKDSALAGNLIMVAQKIARSLEIADDGYKLLIREKSHGGQEIDHLHMHLIGGVPLAEDIKPM